MRFSKSESPQRINRGEGWDRTHALLFMDEHGVPFRGMHEDHDCVKFRHRALERPSGTLTKRTDTLPRGVAVMLTEAAQEEIRDQ